MNFLHFKDGLETQLKQNFELELLELSYLPYCFGHATIVYRIKGYNWGFIYDGKDDLLTCKRSNRHEKYPNCSWKIVFENKGLILDNNKIDLILRATTALQ